MARKDTFIKKSLYMSVVQIIPALALIFIWHVATNNRPERQFIFASPEKVYEALKGLLLNGELVRHASITVFEAASGFIIGTSLGAIIGLGLWYSAVVARIAKPYIIAVGSVPVFALAPVMIMWFGIGIFSKIMMAVLSTIIVAIVQAYTGALSVEDKYLKLMRILGAARFQTFRKVVVPSALIWVVNSMKLNVGFALLGAFIGEFISAEKGLGYLIVKSAGLYDMATVFAGCLTLIVISIAMTGGVGLLERKLLPWRIIK